MFSLICLYFLESGEFCLKISFLIHRVFFSKELQKIKTSIFAGALSEINFNMEQQFTKSRYEDIFMNQNQDYKVEAMGGPIVTFFSSLDLF